MTDDALTMPASDAQKEDVPILPDTGLSYEQIAAAIAERHKIALAKDDPDLIIVTILNAFLAKQAELQDRHQKALNKFLGELMDDHAKTVRDGAAEVSKTLSALTIEGMNEAAKDMVRFRTTLFLCTTITALSALLMVAAAKFL